MFHERLPYVDPTDEHLAEVSRGVTVGYGLRQDRLTGECRQRCQL